MKGKRKAALLQLESSLAEESTAAMSIKASVRGILTADQKKRYALAAKHKRHMISKFGAYVPKNENVRKGLQKPGKRNSATRYCNKCGWLGTVKHWTEHWAKQPPREKERKPLPVGEEPAQGHYWWELDNRHPLEANLPYHFDPRFASLVEGV